MFLFDKMALPRLISAASLFSSVKAVRHIKAAWPALEKEQIYTISFIVNTQAFLLANRHIFLIVRAHYRLPHFLLGNSGLQITMTEQTVEVLFKKVMVRSIAQIHPEALIQLPDVHKPGTLHPEFNSCGIGTFGFRLRQS